MTCLIKKLPSFTSTNKLPANFFDRCSILAMQSEANMVCEMSLSNGDAHGRAMDHFISQMNSESEAPAGLLEPLAIDALDWESFGRHSSVPARIVSRTKRLVSLLRPKSRRQQVYQICEVLAEDELIQLKKRWAMVGILFRTTGDKVRSMYRNYQDRAGTARPGRPKALSDDQVRQLIQQVSTRAEAKNPMTRGDVTRYAYSEWIIIIRLAYWLHAARSTKATP